jgi:phospholipid/cholesterol/gamma-HCH transport system ATP-binding protein
MDPESGHTEASRPAVSDGAAEVIAVENLGIRYGTQVVLEDINFRVYRGERFIILGESGCGKSALLKHMIGLEKAWRGRVLINGVDVVSSDEKNLRRIRMGLGVLFQGDALFGSMTLFDNVALPLFEYTDLDPEMIEDIVRMKLALVNLSGFEDRLPDELSGGMKKRAGMARAMALDPQLLFLDEPWAGLDPVTAAELDDLIMSINKGIGTTLVIVTQELASIFSVADRVIMLDRSARGIIAEGDPVKLKEESTDPRVVNYFNRRSTQKKF